MKHLFQKEITRLFSSTTGIIVLLLWSLLQSLFIWCFESDYNIPLSGVASMGPLFSLMPLLLLVFVPAITMGGFSDKQQLGGAALLHSSPIHSFSSVTARVTAIFLYLSVAVLLTTVFVVSISFMAVAGLDGRGVLNGYIAILLIGGVFATIAVFTSTITRYPIVAYLLALLLNLIFFYGFEFIAALIPTESFSNAIAGYGMHAHYKLLVNGLFDSRTFVYLLVFVLFFMRCSSIVLKRATSLQKGKRIVGCGLIVAILLLFSSLFNLQIDVNGTDRFSYSSIPNLYPQKESPRIAFIEGHGEVTEPYVFEATRLLSHYFTIDRGVMLANPASLFPYKVIVIVGSRTPFTEVEKFALDCYVMQGGSLFFLLDGVSYSEDLFNGVGESVTYKNENNLDDLLFTYGVRMNAELLQDVNCTPIRLATTDKGKIPTYTALPWFFSPLLQPNASHPITAQLSPMQSEFVSSLSLVTTDSICSHILLTTSNGIHTLPVPEKISLRYVDMPVVETYFNESSKPVAVLLEGHFNSLFRYQSIPKVSLSYTSMYHPRSSFARIIVAASSSLIKNKWETVDAKSKPIPLGYEPSMQTQLGNASFIVNAVNYLGGNKSLVELQERKDPLYLLHQKEVTLHLRKWQILNTLVPLFLLGILFFTIGWYRKNPLKRHK